VAPADADLLAQAGDLERRRDRPADAEVYYRRALARQPDSPRLLWQLANAVAWQNRVEEAAALLERALELAPDDPRVLSLLGQVRRQRGDYVGAIDVLSRALALRPVMAEAYLPGAYYELALSHTVLRQWEAAQQAIAQAVALAPEDAEIVKLHRVLEHPEHLIIE
jgi:tetratricopeptide (TPR) repeat protein